MQDISTMNCAAHSGHNMFSGSNCAAGGLFCHWRSCLLFDGEISEAISLYLSKENFEQVLVNNIYLWVKNSGNFQQSICRQKIIWLLMVMKF
jgi:hypothetical protein